MILCFKNMWVAFMFVAATHLAMGQGYTLVPAASIVADAPYNRITHYTIQQQNLTESSLIFHWRQISLEMPTGWTANLCDNGHCFTGFPQSGIMDTVFEGDMGLLSVAIDPGSLIGRAVIRYVLWEEQTPEIKDTLTWIINAGNLSEVQYTRTQEPLLWLKGNTLYLNDEERKYTTLRLQDLSGREVFCTELSSKQEIELPLLPPSLYSILLNGKQPYYTTIDVVLGTIFLSLTP